MNDYKESINHARNLEQRLGSATEALQRIYEDASLGHAVRILAHAVLVETASPTPQGVPVK